MTRFLSYVLSAMLLAFSGAALAGTGSAGSVITQGQIAQAQPSDQDPKSPPDCKKYPKDTRCGKK
ncbi:hypothetical protein D3C83_154970 [compost metagenome]